MSKGEYLGWRWQCVGIGIRVDDSSNARLYRVMFWSPEGRLHRPEYASSDGAWTLVTNYRTLGNYSDVQAGAEAFIRTWIGAELNDD